MAFLSRGPIEIKIDESMPGEIENGRPVRLTVINDSQLVDRLCEVTLTPDEAEILASMLVGQARPQKVNLIEEEQKQWLK